MGKGGEKGRRKRKEFISVGGKMPDNIFAIVNKFKLKSVYRIYFDILPFFF